ncbi:MAG: OmpA family protein, partial [Melioribacteraceae bacterium]|nr:OmpA family protein [Melioribacteraceae bacterium]
NWGSDKYNMDLSKRRALSVKSYLVAQGIDPTRLFTSGCGERMPIADNSTPEGRAINRRIEFSLYDGKMTECPKPEGSKVQLQLTAEEKVIAEKLEKEGDLSFSNINFEYNSAELTGDSKLILDNVVHVLEKLDTLNIEIQGHTDSDGSDIYNQNLSERRAASVKNYLVSSGINPDRLSSKGYGEKNPIAENTTEEGKAKNRRIEFKVIR